MAAKRAAKSKPKPSKTAKTKQSPASADPTTNDALQALPATYAAPPDIPVAVATRELTSLARLARAQHARLSAIGITSDKIAHLAAFARRLGILEKAWLKARSAVKLSPAQRKLRDEAEALDANLVAGGRWACRADTAAQDELSRIAEGSGLDDTIQDLRDLVIFWTDHAAELSATDITKKDLTRATQLADALEEAAAHEASDVDAAAALELRNRAFWAGDHLAKEIRDGGRYAFRGQPKIAAKFASRYRASAQRKHRRKVKAKETNAATAAKAPQGTPPEGPVA